MLELASAALGTGAAKISDDAPLQFAFTAQSGEDLRCFLEPNAPSRSGDGGIVSLARLRDEAARTNPIAVTGVASAYFLARWVARRITGNWKQYERPEFFGNWGTIIFSNTSWRPSGRFPLGPVAGELVRDILERTESAKDDGSVIAALKNEALALIKKRAKQSDFSIFTPRLRYLFHNLEAMGLNRFRNSE